ncbi:unnamed protein product [Calypogeia fissa]
MSNQGRSPLVLVSTAAVVDSILTRSCGLKISADANPDGCSSSDSKCQRDGEDISGVVLAAGLLLWQGTRSTSVANRDILESTPVRHLIKRRGSGKEWALFDESTTVGVTASVLKRLSLVSGSLVMIKDQSNNCAKPARVMVLDPPEDRGASVSPRESKLKNSWQNEELRTKTFPTYNLTSKSGAQLDPEVAFLSPVLAFNLGVYVSWLEFLISSTCDPPSISPGQDGAALRPDFSDSFSWSYFVQISPFLPALERPFSENTNQSSATLPHNSKLAQSSRVMYATHVRIGLVRIPTENVLRSSLKGRQAEIDASLHDYFKTDRFLSKGDLFSIQLGNNNNKTGTMDMHNAEQSPSRENNPPLEFLFFKVLALEPSTETMLCANHNHTALVLVGSVASQLPPLSRPTYFQNVLLRTPVVQHLVSLLAPCLHPKVPPLQLRLSVLLHGPSGSGKQTVVRLATEDLGMHVVEFNCYDFVGTSEGKTAAALMNAFKSAKRYSPSILLLRWFEALGKSSAAGSSPLDQQGAVSRVTSVLKTCMTAHLPSMSSEDFSDAGESVSDGEIADSCTSIPVKVSGMRSGPKDGLVLLIATCKNAENLTPALRRCFTHEIHIGMPDEDQRLNLLRHYLGAGGYSNSATQNVLSESLEGYLKVLAAQTSGLTPRDLRAVAADAGAAAITRSVQDRECLLKKGSSSMKDVTEPKSGSMPNPTDELAIDHQGTVDKIQSLIHVSTKDVETVFQRVKLRTASAIGTPKVPNVKWEDVGGLEDVKKAILDTVQLPLVHRELFASGLRQRSGVLLYGPPGTGKTLLAKAVATECALNFLSVKGPELINMYIGESEKNVREIFQKARTARPCVVFFDELDALAPARGASGDSGGVMDRVVSQMLAEIDGVSENSQDLFIIGASNRPDLIDPALLRPGRFDKLLYVGVSSENSYRERVLEALTRKFKLDNTVSLKSIAQRCPVNYTGADMYALCADAWQQAVKRKVSKLERTKGVTDTTATIVVKEEDFIKAMGELTPSLSQAELDRYERLRTQFEGKRPLSSFRGRR